MNNLFNKAIWWFRRRYKWYVVDEKARQRFKDYNILDSFESIQYIIDHKCSISRYGDGELSLFSGKGIGFQEVDNNLVERLQHVLKATDAPNHIVGIPYYLKNVDGTVNLTREFWGDIVGKYGAQWQKIIPSDRKYIDTQISRFYIEYHDRERSARQLQMLKKIWDGRDVVIVEGSQTRSGIGNDLYDNAKSIERILGYATNAFAHYDEMLQAIVENVKPEEGKLILLSYGPTATVLAYDLAKLGYQAVDMGHLDIEYEWYLRGIVEFGEKIDGKYTNEAASGGNVVVECEDENYNRQIICDITRKK